MKYKQFILLFTPIIILTNILYGQDYAEQYLICAERLKGFEVNDYIYGQTVRKG